MADWLSGDLTYQAFKRYFGELRPFKDDDPKRRVGEPSMRQAYAMFRRQAPLRSTSRALTTTATGYNQALVKIIPNGGAKSARGLRDQVAYLTRQHKFLMSDGDLGDVGGELEAEEVADKIEAWSQEFRGSPKFGHTTHLVVSFPKGTDADAAKRAGEEFAERAFSEGKGGDCFDYMTIQHTDTDFPHTHILVRNRGLYEGAWFTIRRGSAHEPSVLRALQVEVAANYDVRLSATTRLERGIKDRPVTTPEYRLAIKEGRAPKAEPLTPQEDMVLDVLIGERAVAYGALAETIDEQHGDLKEALLAAATLLKSGGIIVPKTMSATLQDHSIEDILKSLDEKKAELARRLEASEKGVKHLKDPERRAEFQAGLGVLKATSAKHFPERADLQIFARGEAIEAFREGFQFERDAPLKLAHSAHIKPAYEVAEKNIRAKASDLGIDADEVLARYKVSSAVRHETARRWHLEEVRDVTQKHPDMEPDRARKSVVDFHAYVRDELKKANRVIAAELRAQNVDLSPDLPRETPLPKHALTPFEEILPRKLDRPRSETGNDIKPHPRPRLRP